MTDLKNYGKLLTSENRDSAKAFICDSLKRLNLSDIDEIDLQDKSTFEMLSRGDTKGVYLFEDDAMTELLQKLKPSRFEDLVALNALCATCVNHEERIQKFIEAKNNPAIIEYPDSSLAEILSETYGVLVYHEQVLQIAQKVAGFSFAQSETLRRNLGKKKSSVINRQKNEFENCALKNGYTIQTADKIFDFLANGSCLTFSLPASVSYTTAAYKMAWVKCKA